MLRADAVDTADGLEQFAPGDGERWLEMVAQWQRLRDPLLDALFTPFPPLAPMVSLLRRTGTAEALELARLAVTPVRRLGRERFAARRVAPAADGQRHAQRRAARCRRERCVRLAAGHAGPGRGLPRPPGGAGRLATALERRAAEPGSAGADRGAGQPGARLPRAGRRGADAGRVGGAGPRRARRRLRPQPATATCSAPQDVPRGLRGRPAVVRVGHLDAQGQLGARPARSRGPHRERAAPGRSTSGWTSTGSSTSRPTCPPGARRSGRSSCSAR